MHQRRIYRVACCLILLAVSACDQDPQALKDSPATGPDPGAAAFAGGEPDTPPAKILEGDLHATPPLWVSDPYWILTDDRRAPVIRGDTLTVTVSYSGGCKVHDFTLLSSEIFTESDPPRLRVALDHDAHGDRCRAILTDTRQFDLAPIKVLYQTTYGEDAGTVLLILQDTYEDVFDLVYDFAS